MYLSGAQLMFAEFFAGAGKVAKVFLCHGYRAAQYDIKYDRIMQNMLTPQGFAQALQICRRLCPGAAASLRVSSAAHGQGILTAMDLVGTKPSA